MPIQGASVRSELSGLRIPFRCLGRAVVRWAGIKLMLDRAARKPSEYCLAPFFRSPAMVRVSRPDPRL
jgi:hypothetical protein